MKLPAQAPELRPRDEQNRRIGGRFEATVRPSGVLGLDIECTLCKAACQLLPGPLKTACLFACNATVC